MKCEKSFPHPTLTFTQFLLIPLILNVQTLLQRLGLQQRLLATFALERVNDKFSRLKVNSKAALKWKSIQILRLELVSFGFEANPPLCWPPKQSEVK